MGDCAKCTPSDAIREFIIRMRFCYNVFYFKLIRKRRDSTMAKPEEMWQCQTVNCGYIYNPDKGDRKGNIPKGTKFEDLPEEWKCPVCGAGKHMFKPLA